MELVVEIISKTGANAGRGLKSGGKWYTAGKRMAGDFKTLHGGDVIEADVNGDFINSYKLAGPSAAAPASQASPATSGAPAKTPYESNKDGQISRGASLKAVIESPYFCGLVKDMGEDEAIAKLIQVSEKFAQYMREGVK
jgi:hypothetical protein